MNRKFTVARAPEADTAVRKCSSSESISTLCISRLPCLWELTHTNPLSPYQTWHHRDQLARPLLGTTVYRDHILCREVMYMGSALLYLLAIGRGGSPHHYSSPRMELPSARQNGSVLMRIQDIHDSQHFERDRAKFRGDLCLC